MYLFFLQDNWTFPGCFSLPNSFCASSVTFSKPHLKENFIHYDFITFNFLKICLIIPLNTLGEASQTFLRLSGKFWACFPCLGGMQGTAFIDELMHVFAWAQQGWCSSAWGIPKYRVSMPGIAFPTFTPSNARFFKGQGEHVFVCFSFYSSKFMKGTR